MVLFSSASLRVNIHTGGCRFEPRPSHTKHFKNALLLGAPQKEELELVSLPGVSIMRLGEYHLICMGHDEH